MIDSIVTQIPADASPDAMMIKIAAGVWADKHTGAIEMSASEIASRRERGLSVAPLHNAPTIRDRMSALGVTPRYVKSYRRRPQPLAKRMKHCRLCAKSPSGICGRHRKQSGVIA